MSDRFGDDGRGDEITAVEGVICNAGGAFGEGEGAVGIVVLALHEPVARIHFAGSVRPESRIAEGVHADPLQGIGHGDVRERGAAAEGVVADGGKRTLRKRAVLQFAENGVCKARATRECLVADALDPAADDDVCKRFAVLERPCADIADTVGNDERRVEVVVAVKGVVGDADRAVLQGDGGGGVLCAEEPAVDVGRAALLPEPRLVERLFCDLFDAAAERDVCKGGAAVERLRADRADVVAERDGGKRGAFCKGIVADALHVRARSECSERSTAAEGVRSDGGNAAAERDGREGGAGGESAVAEGFHVIGDQDACKGAAAVERLCPDGSELSSEGHGRKGAAVFKCLRSDRSDAVRERERAFESAAALERLIADREQPFGERNAFECGAAQECLRSDLADVAPERDGSDGVLVVECLVADADDGKSAVHVGDDDVALRSAQSRNFKGGVAFDLAEGESCLVFTREGNALRPGGVGVGIAAASDDRFDAQGIAAFAEAFEGVGVLARIDFLGAAVSVDAHGVVVGAVDGVP